MRSLRWALIGLGIALGILLMLTRPIFLVYGCAGVAIAIGFRSLWKLLRRIFTPWPGLGLVCRDVLIASGLVFGVSVVLSATGDFWLFTALGLLIISIWLTVRFRKSKTFQRVLVLMVVPVALEILSIEGILRSGAPRPTPMLYTGFASANGQRWTVKHELSFEGEGDDPSIASQDTDHHPSRKEQMNKCGWTEEIENTFSKTDNQTIVSRWLPLRTVNTFVFPPLQCGDMIFLSKENSSLKLSVPLYEIGKTDPAAKERSDKLVGDTETIVIPVEFAWDNPPSLQYQVISPLLRNRLGHIFISGATWDPLKWAILAICGIFAEQIKKGLIIPFVRWIFKTLHLPFKEDEEKPHASEDEDSEAGQPATEERIG